VLRRTSLDARPSVEAGLIADEGRTLRDAHTDSEYE
jgi:hypothetical protein